MSSRIFLDYASATPLDPRVLEAMLPYFHANFSNPSSLYQSGTAAREAIEAARWQVADSVGAKPEEIIFTSGGTEANNLALFGSIGCVSQGKRIVTSTIEHQSILQPCKILSERGCEVVYLPAKADGLVDLENVMFTEPVAIASLMLVNNEVGTIQPVKEFSRTMKRLKAHVHTDACQALGRVVIDVKDLGVDLLTVNSGKIYGPKGMGALFVRKGIRLDPLLYGGKQELGMRAGTENVAAIVGFGKACILAVESLEKEQIRLAQMKQSLLKNLLKLPGVRVNGHQVQTVPNIINVSCDAIEPEALVFYLNAAGVELSSSSACTQTAGASHVLLALGLDQADAQRSIRISLGKMTTEEELANFMQVMVATVEKLRA